MGNALTFQSLAAEIGFSLPSALTELLASNRTIYGQSWPSTWRARCLSDPPALISCADFEWIDAETSREVITEWLSPDFQSGRSFLPFAQSGAGDSYCLTPTDADGLGVAFVWHDAGVSEIVHRSFSDFVCVQFLEAISDLSHLLTEGFTEDESIQVVRADLFFVAACMERPLRDYLLEIRDLPPVHQTPADPLSPSSLNGLLSLISKEQLASEMLKFPRPNDPPFSVTARWECR